MILEDQKSLYRREARSLAAIQRLRFFPLEVEGGEGCYLIEVGGRRLLDFSATWSAAGLGYCHPAVREAIIRTTSNMAGAGVGSICNPEAVGLAEELLALVPGAEDRRVYFGHSGSDANEAVVRAIRRSSGRERLIAFHGSYHGGLAGSSQFSGLMIDNGQPADPALTLLHYPAASGTDALDMTLGELDEALGAGSPAAALIVEPILSDGGMIVPPVGFLRELKIRCDAVGALLICDEVKVGLGRSGLLHAFQVEDIVPDVVTLGKSLGGGLPIAAAIGPKNVMNVAEAFTMLTTAGNPICVAAARAVLRTIVEDDLAGRAGETGQYLFNGLMELASRHTVIREVRGRGLALGVELGDDKPHLVGPTLAAKVVYRAWQLGLVLFYVGSRSNVLEITPPLIISKAEVDRALETLEQSLNDVLSGRLVDEEVAAYVGW